MQLNIKKTKDEFEFSCKSNESDNMKCKLLYICLVICTVIMFLLPCEERVIALHKLFDVLTDLITNLI